jgi:hypothetical protein
MTWLLAVVLSPLGSLLLFGAAAWIAFYVVSPLIPSGRVKMTLYDRGVRRRHPWKFAVLGLIACYGVIGLVYWLTL